MTPEEEQRYMAMLMREQQQQQPAQGGGPPPGAMQAASQFMGGGGGAGAGAGAGGSGGGSMMAAAGPWAALAAAIAVNETQARKQGRRDEDPMKHAQDAFTGVALEQDAAALGDKIGGPLGEATEFMGEMGNPEGALKNIGKSLMPWEWF